MKKLLLFLLAAWGLTALSATARAQGETTTPTIPPLSNFTISLVDKSSRDFVDLSKLAGDDNSDAAQEAGFFMVEALGASITANSELNDYYYSIDVASNSERIAKQISASDKNVTALDLTSLMQGSQATINFMGKEVKSLIISALGGIYFSTESMNLGVNTGTVGDEETTTPTSPTIEAPIPGTNISSIAPVYGISLYPYLAANGNLIEATRCGKRDEVKDNSGKVTQTEYDTVPCYFGLNVDQEAGVAYIVVQYQYAVNGQPWIFQIQIDNSGASLFMRSMACTEGFDYNLALGIKRESETQLIGGTTQAAAFITDRTKGIPVTHDLINEYNEKWDYTNKLLSSRISDNFTLSNISYSTVTAKVTLDAATKTALNDDADAKLLIIASHSEMYSQGFLEKDYAVGDNATEFEDFFVPVVYHDRPADMDNIEFTFNQLRPGKNYYLLACVSSKDEDDIWTYDDSKFLTSAPFTTSLLPGPTGVTASAATQDNKVTLTIKDDACSNCSYMAIKTQYGPTDFTPRGNLAVGNEVVYMSSVYNPETYESEPLPLTATVAGFANSAKTMELTLTTGERAYVMVYKVANAGTTTAAYSNEKALTMVAVTANGLPITYQFAESDYFNPEYLQPLDAMPILPPGFSTTTAYSETGRSTAFLVTSAEEEKYCLGSEYALKEIPTVPVWPNFTTPAFKGVEKKVQATFNVRLFDGVKGHRGTTYTARKPQAGDSILIEYSKNDGAWQKAALFVGEDMPCDMEANYNLPLEAFVECASTDVLRFRYSYTTVPTMVTDMMGDEYPSITLNAVSSIELVEARNCATPAKLAVAQDGITDESIKIKWDDQNAKPAQNFLVQYIKYVAPAKNDDEQGGPMPRTDGEDPDYGGNNPDDDQFGQDVEWQSVMVSTTEALLAELEANTAYTIKVQAVCGANDSSFFTIPVRLSTAAGLPYDESLSSAVDMEAYEVTAPNVKSYIGEPGEDLKEEGLVEFSYGEVKGWSTLSSSMQSYDEEEGPSSYALSISSEAKDKAWIVTPSIYVPKTGEKEPKTLKFKADPYSIVYDDNGDAVLTHGIDLEEEDLRLYVFASTNGKFTWNDTVSSFAAADLTFEVPTPAEGETANPKPGKELSVEMDKFEGVMQLGFYFHNPNADPDIDNFTKFLQIFNIEFNYDNTCRPVEKLAYSGVKQTEATLTWKGEGAQYGITYGEASADESTYTTKYQNAQTTDDGTQTIKLEGLKSNTNYKVKMVSYCTVGENPTGGSIARTITFTTTKQMFTVKVDVQPNAEAGSVEGAASYLEGSEATLTATAKTGYKFVGYFEGETELSTDATYKFTASKNITITAKFVEEQANETQLRAEFRVSTDNGNLLIGNLGGIKVKDVTVYNLAGRLLGQFAVSSTDNLTLPVNAERTIIFVRLNTEKGVAVYKVYLQ